MSYFTTLHQDNGSVAQSLEIDSEAGERYICTLSYAVPKSNQSVRTTGSHTLTVGREAAPLTTFLVESIAWGRQPKMLCSISASGASFKRNKAVSVVLTCARSRSVMAGTGQEARLEDAQVTRRID